MVDKVQQHNIYVLEPWSYSNERHEYCKSLDYDIMVLTELHNNQNNPQFEGERWKCNELTQEVDGKKHRSDGRRHHFVIDKNVSSSVEKRTYTRSLAF